MPVIGDPASLTIETILVPTDFGVASGKAVLFAREIAKRFRSSVTLMNVLNEPVLGGVDGFTVPFQEFREEAARRLDLTATEFTGSGIDVRTSVFEGISPSSAVLQLAQEIQAQMIIVGTSSKQGFERLALGSTAEQILRQAACPVLTVGPKADPPSADLSGFRTIVYATDFSPQAAKAAIYALSFAEDNQAKLYLCHVLDVWSPKTDSQLSLERDFEASLKKLIPDSAYDWCTPECVVEHGDPAEAILALAEKVKADLIVLGARKSSFWLTHIEQGMTPTLLASAKCPVLSVS